LALTGKARGADPVTLRWWSPQASPDQLKMYQAQIAAFEAANPNIKILFEPTSDEGYPAQFAAAFSSKQLPNVVTHLPSFAAQNYYGQDLLEPMDDVINAIGPDNYFPGANDVYKTADGHCCGTPIGNTAADMLWLRKDLMEKAGIDKAPATWDELRAACQKMQGGGIYGAPLPYGLNSMTSLIFIGFIHRAGGNIFSPDLAVAIDDKPTYDAIEFYKSMREFCPPGPQIIAGVKALPRLSRAPPRPASMPAAYLPMSTRKIRILPVSSLAPPIRPSLKMSQVGHSMISLRSSSRRRSPTWLRLRPLRHTCSSRRDISRSFSPRPAMCCRC
jgi:ABC-type glycerol-3-phosphate transport system substrate-binding protein